jgi:DNA-binding NarL/FixJ family response regulator
MGPAAKPPVANVSCRATNLEGENTTAPAVSDPGQATVTPPTIALEPLVKSRDRVHLQIAAENRLLREALARMLRKTADIEVVGAACLVPQDPGAQTQESMQSDSLPEERVDVFLLVSSGNLDEDILAIQKVRASMPDARVLLIGTGNEEGEFLQCVRAGMSGFLRREASTKDVAAAIRAVYRGESVCPGELCAVLFRYFERESSALPCAGVRQQLGFTRREQQLIPLIAKGLTNKEIANHFCLSEQTVKNHLYRMKHKVGAEDRLSIVQRYRTQGFLL